MVRARAGNFGAWSDVTRGPRGGIVVVQTLRVAARPLRLAGCVEPDSLARRRFGLGPSHQAPWPGHAVARGSAQRLWVVVPWKRFATARTIARTGSPFRSAWRAT